jgi:hypothetical protein
VRNVPESALVPDGPHVPHPLPHGFMRETKT